VANTIAAIFPLEAKSNRLYPSSEATNQSQSLFVAHTKEFKVLFQEQDSLLPFEPEEQTPVTLLTY